MLHVCAMFWGYVMKPATEGNTGRKGSAAANNKMRRPSACDIGDFMRLLHYIAMAALVLPLPCLAQEWEAGAAGGYGWYSNPSIVTPAGSVQSGFAPKAAIGAVFGQNMYEYIGGEVRYLFQFGGPRLRFDGSDLNATGYSNLITYDFLFHLTNRESKFRPFVAGGAGVKIYTGGQLRFASRPFPASAVLVPDNQVEAAISVGAGVKYRVARHVLLRLDFRTYMTPFPDQILRPTGLSQVHGWIYNFVPLGGVSFIF